MTESPVWQARRKASHDPVALAASLEALRTGMHGPAYPAEIILLALGEMAANGKPFNLNLLRGYCRSAVAAQEEAARKARAAEREADDDAFFATRRKGKQP